MTWVARAVDSGGMLNVTSSPKGVSIALMQQGITVSMNIPTEALPNLTRFFIESGAKFGKLWRGDDDRDDLP